MKFNKDGTPRQEGFTNNNAGVVCSRCNELIAIGARANWNRKPEPFSEKWHLPMCPNGRVNEVTETEIEETDGPMTQPQPTTNNDAFSVLAGALLPFLEERLKVKMDAHQVEAICKRLLDGAILSRVTHVKVIDPVTFETKRDIGIQHKLFPKVFNALQVKTSHGKPNNILLCGPAGSGKTTCAETIAHELGLKYFHFGSMSDEYKMLGYKDVNGKVVSTYFREFWENESDGALALFDEMDSWHATATLALNSMTNGYIDFPDGQSKGNANRRYMIGGVNTWGFGGDNDYVGRNPLDKAFLDRWNVKIAWGYDEEFERAIFQNHPFVKRVQAVRAKAKAKALKVLITPRACDTGIGLLEAGWSQADVEEVVLKGGMRDADWESIR